MLRHTHKLWNMLYSHNHYLFKKVKKNKKPALFRVYLATFDKTITVNVLNHRLVTMDWLKLNYTVIYLMYLTSFTFLTIETFLID